MNLIGNALKFKEIGGIIITVYKKPIKDDKIMRLEFSVKDTGIGIPNNKIHRLFQSFSQLYLTSIFGGTYRRGWVGYYR
jgi:signal transduction histidine kinase